MLFVMKEKQISLFLLIEIQFCFFLHLSPKNLHQITTYKRKTEDKHQQHISSDDFFFFVF